MSGILDTLPLSQIEDDDSFRLRSEGDVSALGQSLAREGQLVPVDVRLRGPGRWQLVTGFRRLAALRLLKRDRVLARLHDSLSDADALRLALADDLWHRALSPEELQALRERLTAAGQYGGDAAEAIEGALGESPPPPEPEEQDLDVFSRDLVERLTELSADLASVTSMWAEVEPGVREQILVHLRYAHDLVPFLEEPAPAEQGPEE
jgi:ParB family transcriptional regulator, chromosome partitioning protein